MGVQVETSGRAEGREPTHQGIDVAPLDQERGAAEQVRLDGLFFGGETARRDADLEALLLRQLPDPRDREGGIASAGLVQDGDEGFPRSRALAAHHASSVGLEERQGWM